MDTRYEETGRVNARGPDGEIYDIVECQIIITFPEGGEIKTTRGGVIYRLLDGRDVERLDGGTFKIVGSDVLLKKI